MHVIFYMQNQDQAKIRNIGVSKTSDHIQIKIKMPTPSGEPPTPHQSPQSGLKGHDVFCTFKIKVECQNFEYIYIKDQ